MGGRATEHGVQPYTCFLKNRGWNSHRKWTTFQTMTSCCVYRLNFRGTCYRNLVQIQHAWMQLMGLTAWHGILTGHGGKHWRSMSKIERNKLISTNQLRVLLMKTEEPKFRVMLQEFLTNTQKYSKFYTYFNQYYCNRLEQWASCYRVKTTVNTNMFLEAFHRVVKIVYLHHKHNCTIEE